MADSRKNTERVCTERVCQAVSFLLCHAFFFSGLLSIAIGTAQTAGRSRPPVAGGSRAHARGNRIKPFPLSMFHPIKRTPSLLSIEIVARSL
jgi:hypothetical protein